MLLVWGNTGRNKRMTGRKLNKQSDSSRIWNDNVWHGRNWTV